MVTTAASATAAATERDAGTTNWVGKDGRSSRAGRKTA